MDRESPIKGMRNTDTEEYKKRAAVSNVGRIIRTFLIFPVTLAAFIGGGFYAAYDAVAPTYYSYTDMQNPGKSRSARKSGEDENAPRLQEESGAETENRDTETETAVPQSDEELKTHLYDFDRSAVPEGKYGIIPMTMYKPINGTDMYIKNSSGLEVDYRDCLDREIPVRCEESDGYTVLIIHTHGTESYTPEGVFYTDKGYYPRSEDKSENVVGIGDVFEETFNKAGIKTLHCEIPIDKASYSKAYTNAAKLIKGFTEEYPSIKYVFDIHRDSVDLSSGEKVKAVTVINGKTAAQVMFVIGTDALVKENANWKDNFAFAIKLQLALDGKYGEFVRPINLKQGAYNQFYTPLSLLIEVGCDGNTFEEAKYSAKLVADELVHILKGE